MKATKLQKYQEKSVEGRVLTDFSHKKALVKVILKNAPSLLGAIPVVGNAVSAVTETAVGTAVDYWDEIATQRREKEWESYLNKVDKRLSVLEVKTEAKDYFENSIIFRFEDIKRKLFTEPERGFDDLLAEFVASALSDLDTPATTKDLILSSLLAIDSVDLKVLLKIDLQFKKLLDEGNKRGASFADIVTLLKPSRIDEIMISRSLQRLQSQDLVHPLSNNTAAIQDLPAQQELLEGVKSPQYYSQGGFVVSAFGRRFLRFLKLSN